MRERKAWYKKKRFIIPVFLVLFLVVLGVAIEPIAERQVNKKLAETSKIVEGHVDDLDINFFEPGVEVKGFTASLKESGKQFLQVEEVDVDLSWRELLTGNVLANVLVDHFAFIHSQALMDALPKLKAELEEMKKEQDKDKDKKDEKPAPVEVASLVIRNSSVNLADYPSLGPDKTPHVSKINGRVSNLSLQEGTPNAEFEMSALLLGSGDIESDGTLNLTAKPLQWSVDGSMKQLDVTTTNEFLRNKVPLTFTEGKIDLYAEAKSEEGVVRGYVKPFAKDVDVMRTKEEFKGAKHWLIELVTAVGNILLASPGKDSVASEVPFTYDGKEMKIEAMEAAQETLKHRFGEEIKPGVEDRLKIK